MPFWQLGTVQHCLGAVKRVWFFTDCILVTLNVNDDVDVALQPLYYLKTNIALYIVSHRATEHCKRSIGWEWSWTRDTWYVTQPRRWRRLSWQWRQNESGSLQVRKINLLLIIIMFNVTRAQHVKYLTLFTTRDNVRRFPKVKTTSGYICSSVYFHLPYTLPCANCW